MQQGRIRGWIVEAVKGIVFFGSIYVMGVLLWAAM